MLEVSRRRRGHARRQRPRSQFMSTALAKRPAERHPQAMSTSATPDPEPAGEAPPFADRRRGTADRRERLWHTLLVSGLAPRRRAGRRAGEHESPVDFHEPYLLLLSVLLLTLSVVDAFLTVTLLTRGAEEANPLLALALGEHPRLFAVVKMALTGIGVVLLVALARTRVLKVIRAGWFLTALVAAYCALVAYEVWLVNSV